MGKRVDHSDVTKSRIDEMTDFELEQLILEHSQDEYTAYARRVYRKRKIDSRTFSKRQATVIMWATVVIALFTAYPTLKSWVLNIDKVGRLFEQNVIPKEQVVTEAIQ